MVLMLLMKRFIPPLVILGEQAESIVLADKVGVCYLFLHRLNADSWRDAF